MFAVLEALLLPHTSEASVAQSWIIIFLVIGLGLLLGKIKWQGISLGISAIMFSWILFWHLGYHINPELSEFLKDFGLILFVYAIGIQVGPYFFSSFKNEWLTFNILAVSTVLVWGWLTILLQYFSGIGVDNFVGIMSGAVTNTPGLWAAKSVLADIARASQTVFSDPTNAYALSYPFGVLWVIILMIVGKKVMKIDLKKEQENYFLEVEKNYPSPARVACRITNPNIFEKSVKEITTIIGHQNIHITRVKKSGTTDVTVPTSDTILHERDVVMIVWPQEAVSYAVHLLGRVSSDTVISSDTVTTHNKQFLLTNKELAFHSLSQLKIQDIYNVRITRIRRAEVEFLANAATVLMVGDKITVVGNDKDLDLFEVYVGNQEKKLNEPELITIAIGIILGIILWSLPITIYGLSYPLKLGMAAGPLLVALLISRYSAFFKISPYMHKSALLVLKDMGIALFFATVGLKAWSTFYSTLVENNWLVWIGYGLLITILPLLGMMLYGYYVKKINFLQLVWLMAASYTDPAALSFSASYFKSDIPNQSYATVYPLVTIMRIIVAQLVILFLV